MHLINKISEGSEKLSSINISNSGMGEKIGLGDQNLGESYLNNQYVTKNKYWKSQEVVTHSCSFLI